MICSADQMAAAVTEAAAIVRTKWETTPRAAIVLGTGLGSLAQHMAVEADWNYSEMPHFARSTADGHRGRLLAGRLTGVPILVMDGRFHAYEGYSFSQITFPIRVFSALGASFLILSNASGGLNSALKSGDILLIDDHINLMFGGGWALLPVPFDRTGTSAERPLAKPRSFYDPKLLTLADKIAGSEQIVLRRGCYIAVLGPNYETRAEYRWLRTLGDVVGMSTVPEVLVANELRLPVVAFSMVTNVFRPADAQQTTSEEVINAASGSEPQLRRLVTRLLSEWSPDSANP